MDKKNIVVIFFNDILEPLFYEAFVQDRGKESIYSRLNNCRMVFLNSGFFELMPGSKLDRNYNWLDKDFNSDNPATIAILFISPLLISRGVLFYQLSATTIKQATNFIFFSERLIYFYYL